MYCALWPLSTFPNTIKVGKIITNGNCNYEWNTNGTHSEKNISWNIEALRGLQLSWWNATLICFFLLLLHRTWHTTYHQLNQTHLFFIVLFLLSQIILIPLKCYYFNLNLSTDQVKHMINPSPLVKLCMWLSLSFVSVILYETSLRHYFMRACL